MSECITVSTSPLWSVTSERLLSDSNSRAVRGAALGTKERGRERKRKRKKMREREKGRRRESERERGKEGD